MIVNTLTKLVAEQGKILTDGTHFTHSILLQEGEDPQNWSEISEAQYNKAKAKMTPREFILALLSRGITRAQIDELITNNDRVWVELNYATLISRANPLLDELCGQFGLTPADVDNIFGL